MRAAHDCHPGVRLRTAEVSGLELVLNPQVRVYFTAGSAALPTSFPRAVREDSRRSAVVLRLIRGPSGLEPNRHRVTARIRVHHSAPEQGVRGVDRVIACVRVRSRVLASGRNSGRNPNRNVGAAGSRDRCSHVDRSDRSAYSAPELSKLNQSADSVAGSDMPRTGQCPKPQSALTRLCTPPAFPRCGDPQSRAAHRWNPRESQNSSNLTAQDMGQTRACAIPGEVHTTFRGSTHEVHRAPEHRQLQQLHRAWPLDRTTPPHPPPLAGTESGRAAPTARRAPIDAEHLHPAETVDQLADTRRDIILRGSSGSACVKLDTGGPTRPSRAHCPLISREPDTAALV